MRILYVCADRGIPLCGDKGASVHVRAITAALSRIGHTVTVAPTTVGTGNPPPAVHGIAPLPDEPRRQRAQLAEVIAAHRPDYYKWDQWFFLKMLERGLA